MAAKSASSAESLTYQVQSGMPELQRPPEQRRPNLESRDQQIQVRGFKISTLTDFDPSTFDSTEMVALEYFHAVTLPVLRAQQSCNLWGAVTHDLMRTSTAFRKILVAVGAQQALLERSSNSSIECQLSVEALYGKALHSFRRCSFLAYREKSLVLMFGAILLANLEALRGSLEGMMVHISHGARLVLESQNTIQTQDEAQAVALLLNRYCATLLLFCDVPADHVMASFGKHKLVRRLVEQSARRDSVESIRVTTSKRNSTRLFSFLCSSAWNP
ncbi:hypothetical protein Slin14017_G109680 [Septoria linicola]|nr:hypothetical protein Slin14017_G109680 [Septoria linicola]